MGQGLESKVSRPNIVIIYADDMGYGDLNCQNPDSKIPTPNLDKLASEGMRFTDAHSSSGVCSPSRFALLTGTYHWRRFHSIVNSFGKSVFRSSDITIPKMLKTAGYETACIGKWHLGWDWQFLSKPSGETEQFGKKVNYYLPHEVDWSKAIKGGPVSQGFDYYFGDGTINFPPYAWIENETLLEMPTETMLEQQIPYKVKEGRWEFRPGPMVKGWNPNEVLPTITKKAVEWIKSRDEKNPFFLYFPLTSPHAPIIPNDEFDGKSNAGPYGDFVFQTDWVAGQVIQALKEKGLYENTIIIFTADNGTEQYAWQRAINYGHFSMGNDRGLKQDVYEGGHHVPFIVRWPGYTKPGSVSTEVISQVDIMKTLAAITGAQLSEKAAPDGYDFTPVLTGRSYNKPLREATIHNTYEDRWGIRQGDWLFINNATGSTRPMPEAFKKLRGYTDFTTQGLLFNMKDDPEQRVNLYEKYPEKVAELSRLIDVYKDSGYLMKD